MTTENRAPWRDEKTQSHAQNLKVPLLGVVDGTSYTSAAMHRLRLDPVWYPSLVPGVLPLVFVRRKTLKYS
jgi:hypothetical protein